MNVQWWCSARDLPWTWAWQAYPGVWLFAIAVGAAAWPLRKRGGWQVPLAIATLWMTLDHPVGPLGAGYLAWVHSAQFLSLAMAVPPLLLLGLDRARAQALLASRPRLLGFVRRATQPLLAMIQFAVVMVVTHLPPVVDAMMATQAGAFALDLAWLVSGLVFWWPVLVRVPERPHFPPLVQMLYLFFGAQPHLYIAMWLLLARFPVYGTYELAPRVSSLSAAADQQIAGGVMLILGGTFILVVITVLFFRWMSRYQDGEPLERSP